MTGLGARMRRELTKKLIDGLGQPYHESLGIDLSEGESGEVFKWFVASVLSGARISEQIAMKTYKQFERDGLLEPKRMLARGWSRLVESLDRGGYVRYDFKTADKFLLLSDVILREYGGDLNRMHGAARDARDLESRLKALKGVGDVTADIFLRELRGIWPKADPLPQEHVIAAARNLGVATSREPQKALEELKRAWQANRIARKGFVNFEIALFRLGKFYCSKSRCAECPVSERCKARR